jgi:pimeloyl-ACP methyl ester carboxylesterase
MEHSNIGSAFTFQGIQGRRPSIFELEDKLRALNVPTLIMTGDEDDPCIETSVYMKRNIPNSGLVVIPRSGHAINLEEPDLFNSVVLDFLTAVESGAWTPRAYGNQSGSLV